MGDVKKNLIIVPTKNEKNTVLVVYNNISKISDYVFVDDSSNDGTIDIYKKNNINFITNKNRRGYDSAINTGIEYALMNGYKKILTFDADNELPASEINNFFNYLEKYEIVVGYRSQMRFIERLFSFFSKFFFTIKDPFCGMKGYSISKFKNKKLDFNYMIGTSYIFGYKSKINIMNIPVKIIPSQRPSRFGNKFISNLKILYVILKIFYRIILKKNNLN